MKPFVIAAMLAAAMPAAGFAQTAPSAEAPAAPFYSTSKTTIGALIDNPATKAIFAKYLPEVLADERLPQALGMTLKDAQPYAPEMITDEKLAKMDEELKTIPAPAPKP
jgi:para-nitrobenzyl esterase